VVRSIAIDYKQNLTACRLLLEPVQEFHEDRPVHPSLATLRPLAAQGLDSSNISTGVGSKSFSNEENVQFVTAISVTAKGSCNS
jgi:hypothetical protein